MCVVLRSGDISLYVTPTHMPTMKTLIISHILYVIVMLDLECISSIIYTKFVEEGMS